MQKQRVLVIGGTGFVGRHLLYRLSRAGVATRVPVRHPFRYRELSLIPGCEVHELADWEHERLVAALEGCDTLINLAGVLNEAGSRQFEKRYLELVRSALQAVEQAGVQRYLHMSALHADTDSPSEYLRRKAQGEALVLAAAERGLEVGIFRPALIFGPGDSLFNRLAGFLRLFSGIMPLGLLPLPCADVRLAPVYVGDVAEAIARSLLDPPRLEATRRPVFELCGPRVFTLRDLAVYTAERLGKRVRVVALAPAQADLLARVLGYLPGNLFSLDNLNLLRSAELCGEHNDLALLNVTPTDIDAVVPDYL